MESLAVPASGVRLKPADRQAVGEGRTSEIDIDAAVEVRQGKAIARCANVLCRRKQGKAPAIGGFDREGENGPVGSAVDAVEDAVGWPPRSADNGATGANGRASGRVDRSDRQMLEPFSFQRTPANRRRRRGRKAMAQISLAKATAVSAMRFEKPHSLSYQERTRTNLPSRTLVWSMAKIDEWLSWLKSRETSGSSV